MSGAPKVLRGIQWPIDADGERSSTDTAKAIWARSFAQLDKSLPTQIESEQVFLILLICFCSCLVKMDDD